MTLENTITWFIIKSGCDSPQLNKIVELLRNGNEIEAYQTIFLLDLYSNQLKNHIDLDWSEVETKANHIGKQWHSNGQLEYEATLKNNQLHGSSKWWHSNGQLALDENYINGKLHGLRQSWYGNGRLCNKANYVDGKRI